MEVIGTIAAVLGTAWVLFWGSRTIPDVIAERRRKRLTAISDLPPGQSSVVLQVVQGRLTTLALDARGMLLAFAGFSGDVHVLDLGSGQSRVVARHTSIVRVVRFHPALQAVASAGDDGLVRMTYLDTGGEKVIGQHAGPVYTLVFDLEGRVLRSGGRDGFIRTWRIGSAPLLLGHPGTLVPPPRPEAELRHDEGGVFSLENVSLQDRQLMSAGTDGRVRLWDLSLASAVVLGQYERTVFCCAASPASSRIACAVADGGVYLWEGAQDSPKQVLEHQDSVRWVAFDVTGVLLASASKDKTIRLWHCDAGRGWVLSGHTDYVYAVTFHPSDGRLFSAGGDGTIREWTLPLNLLETS